MFIHSKMLFLNGTLLMLLGQNNALIFTEQYKRYFNLNYS